MRTPALFPAKISLRNLEASTAGPKQSPPTHLREGQLTHMQL